MFSNASFLDRRREEYRHHAARFSGVTPDGQAWDTLANRAGGKQTQGIMGVSIGYIRSRHFLKGDGGIKNLVWVASELYDKIANILTEGQKVATEKDVSILK